MASNGFVFYYGNYSHVPGEVYPKAIQVIPQPNQDGIRWASTYRMEIGGDFLNADGSAMNSSQVSARIAQFDDVYKYDYQDCGFIDPDGGQTPHRLLTNDVDNLSGNRIVRRSWDNRMPTEYANTRSFSVTIEALFRESYQEIIGFTESVSKKGTGGPVWELNQLWDGTPYKETVHNYSKVTHVQTGTIVGLNRYPDPLIISPPYWPEEEKQWLRTITRYSPKYHGHPSFGDKGTHYRVDYTYFFERPTAAPLSNNLWGNSWVL